MTDAESSEVGNDGCRLNESKVAIELQAISRARYVGTRHHDFRNQTTDHGGSVPCLNSFSLTSLLL